MFAPTGARWPPIYSGSHTFSSIDRPASNFAAVALSLLFPQILGANVRRQLTTSAHVLFLRKTQEGDFLILTGYELSDEGITPIDGEGNEDPRADLPLKKYRGVDEATFLKDLSDAVRASGVSPLMDKAQTRSLSRHRKFLGIHYRSFSNSFLYFSMSRFRFASSA